MDRYIVFGNRIANTDGGMQDSRMDTDKLEEAKRWLAVSSFKLDRYGEMDDEERWGYIYDSYNGTKICGYTKKEAEDILALKDEFQLSNLCSYLSKHEDPPAHWYSFCGLSYRELPKLDCIPRYTLESGCYYVLDANTETLEHEVLVLSYDRKSDKWATKTGLLIFYHKPDSKEAIPSDNIIPSNYYLIRRVTNGSK